MAKLSAIHAKNLRLTAYIVKHALEQFDEVSRYYLEHPMEDELGDPDGVHVEEVLNAVERDFLGIQDKVLKLMDSHGLKETNNGR